MKRYLIYHFMVILLFFVLMDTFSQTSLKAVRVEPSASLKKKLLEKMKSYQLFTLPASTLKTKGESQLSFTIETLTEKWNVELAPNEIRSPDCKIIEYNEKGAKEILMPDCPTFAGKVNGNNAHFYIEGNLMSATMYPKNDVTTMEPLSWFLGTKEFGDYTILYKSSDIYEIAGGTCGVKTITDKFLSSSTLNQPPRPAYCKVINVAVEYDVEFNNMFTAFSGGAYAKALAIMQKVDAIYYNDIGVRINVSWLGGWASNNPNAPVFYPYTSTTAFPTVSDQFWNYWNTNSNRTGIIRDMAHLLTGKELTGPGGIGLSNGEANQKMVCSADRPYSMSDRGNNTDNDWASCVCHELGHNLGHGIHDSDQGYSCTAGSRYIMCEGNGKNGTFSPLSQNTIKTFLNNVYCLGTRTTSILVKVDGITINSTPTYVSAGSHILNSSGNDPYANNNSYSYSSNNSQVSLSPSGSNCTFNTNGASSFTMTIAYTNSCGTFYRSIPFVVRSSFRVAPNPTNINTVTVMFNMDDKNDNTSSLPTDVILYNDKNEIIESSKPQEVYKAKSLSVQNNQITFDLKGYPKGLYVLSATFADGYAEKIKVILE